jgi:hypothetical protein
VPLETRTFHVNPNTFREGLKRLRFNSDDTSVTNYMFNDVDAVHDINDAQKVVITFHDSPPAIDVFLGTNNLNSDGKVVAYNDQKGLITVRATSEDLEQIERVIGYINQISPQINLKVKFAIITNDFARIHEGLSMLPVEKSTNSIDSANCVLSPYQFTVWLQNLEQRIDTKILTAPEVTTETGRQVQIQAANLLDTNAPDWPISFSPTIDVIPYIAADGADVQMTVIPTTAEFIGYDEPGKFDSNGTTNSLIVSTQPVSHFKLRQLTSDCLVPDAETLVIARSLTVWRKIEANPSSPATVSPLPANATMLIFITPTLINPDGTRYHPEK